MTERVLAWHWIRDDLRLRHPPHALVEPGQTLSVEGPLDLGANGLHGSFRALDALRYAPGFAVARTEHEGEIIYDVDKLCSRTRTVLWVLDARLMVLDWLHLIIDRALTWEIDAGREPDARLLVVPTTLQRIMDGEAGSAEIRNAVAFAAFAANAADAAAHTAAHATYADYDEASRAYADASAVANVARAAAYAARAVANSTDGAANAARAAVNAARATGHPRAAAEWEWMNRELEQRLFAAHEREAAGIWLNGHSNASIS
jgi:hypothetical protein